MKSLVFCKPSYGNRNKEEKVTDKQNKNGTESSKSKVNTVKISDIEVCQVVGTLINGKDKSGMKDESSKGGTAGEEMENEENGGNFEIEESIKAAADGSDDTCKDEVEIEILSCSFEKEDLNENDKRATDDALKKLTVEDSTSLKNCVDNSKRNEFHLGSVNCVETSDSDRPCAIESKPIVVDSEEYKKGRSNIKEIESDREKSVFNTDEGGTIKNLITFQDQEVEDEKIEDEFNVEEVEREKQSSDEGFIEEEENKENRSDKGCGSTNFDGKSCQKENNITPVLECLETKWEAMNCDSKWNGHNTDFRQSLETHKEEGCTDNNDVNMDEMETPDYEKTLEKVVKNEACGIPVNEDPAPCSNEKIPRFPSSKKPGITHNVESCPEMNEDEYVETHKELIPKRKRLSVDGNQSSSIKKRRTEINEIVNTEIKRRHSHDAAFTLSENDESCLYSDDNEKIVENKDMDSCSHKKNALEESIDRVASAQIPLPFLEGLRGTIKKLSRSDLEELIVQKLCEVITERSTVGDLRKKAQALEQDQEKWKEKVQSLTKQLKEMDMVMKKYMSEVQKQSKEKNFQMVTPLRVTRSVGLQVSFGSPNSKPSRVIQSNNQMRQSATCTPESLKQTLPPSTEISQNSKKNVPILPNTQNKKQMKEQKKPFSPRLGVNVTFQARLISPQNVVSPNRTLQTQMNTSNRPRLPGTDQNSKIIDLTDDDDRQNSQTTQKAVLQPGVTVRPPGQIRVVNHIQPAQVNSAGRVAYLVPATTASGSGSTVPPQSRQLLIATPTVPPPPRQLLPSVPPLLYKGSTILQPGAQQPTIINQQNRTLMPKKLKHPAPLPQPPANQIQKPNLKLLPPRPALKISKVQTGIVLSWNMTLGPEYEPIASYQLYAYQENNSPPATSLWKKVGDVKALPLPMACTLTQFMSGHKYYFAVRAVDLHSRIGPFSFPGSIVLIK